MGYYKLIHDGQIISVIENPIWVKQNRRGYNVACEALSASGIVSKDAERTYHIVGTPPLSGDYESVIVADVTKDEFDELSTMLGLGATVSDDETVVWVVEEEKIEPVDSGNLVSVKARKLDLLSRECQECIFAGADVALSDGDTHRFTMTLEDQINLMELKERALAGESPLAYHSSGSLCEYYSREDILTICETLSAHKARETAYFNSLKHWVTTMTEIAVVGAVAYGDAVPDEFCSEYYLDIRG